MELDELKREVGEVKADIVSRIIISVLCLATLVVIFIMASLPAYASEFGVVGSNTATSTWFPGNGLGSIVINTTSSLLAVNLFVNGVASSTVNAHGVILERVSPDSFLYSDCPFTADKTLPVITDYSSSSNPYSNATTTILNSTCGAILIPAGTYRLSEAESPGVNYGYLGWGDKVGDELILEFNAIGYFDYTQGGGIGIQKLDFLDLFNLHEYMPFQYWKLNARYLNASDTIKVHYSTPYEDVSHDNVDYLGPIIKSSSSLSSEVWIPVQHDLYDPLAGASTYWQAWAGIYDGEGNVRAWTDTVNFLVFLGNETVTPVSIGSVSSTVTSTTMTDFGNAPLFKDKCTPPSSTVTWWNPLTYPTYFNWEHMVYGGCLLSELLLTPDGNAQNFMVENFNTLRGYFPLSVASNIISPVLALATNTSTPSTTLEMDISGPGKVTILSSSTINGQLGTDNKNLLRDVQTMIIWASAAVTAFAIIL